MKMFIAGVLMLAGATTAFGQDFIQGEDIQTVQVSASGVEFRYNPGEGGRIQTVTISGQAGSDCLRTFMYFDALKRENKEVYFTVDTAAKTCNLQVKMIGA